MGPFPFFPDAASTVAGQTDLLTLALILISAALIAIVGVFIVYFSFKYRAGRAADRKNPPSGNTKVEVTWIGSLLVLALTMFSWATLNFYRINRPPANSLDIYVIGKQWMWKVQHQEGPKEIDTLHIPLGQPIRLVMTSQDVIHSFYIPAFRLKQDVLPGRYTYMWFQPTETGEFHLFCAEYCGTSHAQMRGTVIVMEPYLYQQWLSTNSTGQPLIEGGRQLFTQLGCAHCHASESGVRAPRLAGVFGQTVPLADGTNVVADENYIRESIFFPTAKIVAGYEPIMPTYEGRITEEQVLQLVAYIRSIGVAPDVIPGGAP
jgi:cytochrome c oxidase subunit 2